MTIIALGVPRDGEAGARRGEEASGNVDRPGCWAPRRTAASPPS
jgi:hypothetical protein